MPAEICLLTGPARSGKTQQLLCEYRDALRRLPPGACLWLSPNRQGVDEVVGRLLCTELPTCFGPGVTTFSRLGGIILKAARVPVRPITPAMTRQILRDLIGQAIEAGTLRHFGPIAHTEGMVSLVEGLIRELKRLEIWPEDLAKAIDDSARMAKDVDVLNLYQAYQSVLLAHNLYDREGQFWEARDLLKRDSSHRLLRGLKWVVIDGFSDFTRTQHEVLHALADRAEHMTISLPLDDEPGREDLFAKPRATIEKLRRRFPNLTSRTLPRWTGSGWPALDRFEQAVFGNPMVELEPLPCEPPLLDRVEIIAASGELGEIQQVARRIKSLLVDGDAPTAAVNKGATKPRTRASKTAAAAVCPQEITVVFRSLGEAAPLVREVFSQYGIPFALEQTEPLASAPAVRALVGLLKLDSEDWSFAQLLATLNHAYFRPNWAEWQAPGVLAAAERTVRLLQVSAGRKTLLQEVARLIDRGRAASENRDSPGAAASSSAEAGISTPGDSGDDEQHWDETNRHAVIGRRAALALPLLQRLGATLDSLPDQATCQGWATALKELAIATGILRPPVDELPLFASQAPTDPQVKADAAAIDQLCAMVREADRLEQWLHPAGAKAAQSEAPHQIDRAAAHGWLQQIARDTPLPPPCDEIGRVRVLTAQSARAISTRYLFLAGLSEKAFPQSGQGDGVYSEHEAQRLIAAGLDWVTRRERSQDEMLLFYEVLTRGRQRMYLSFPALDDKAQPLSPSPYLTELERICGGKLARNEIHELSPVPLDGPLYCPAELRVKGVAQALAGEGSSPSGAKTGSHAAPIQLLGGWLQTAGRAAAGAKAGLQLIAARVAERHFGPFEGLLLGEAARAVLAKKFGPDMLWSASQLEQYASCPHRFFLQRLLQLEPFEEPSLATDYIARGTMLHSVWATIHRHYNDKAGGPCSPVKDDAAAFDAALATVLVEFLAKRQRGPLESALSEIDRRLLVQWGKNYLAHHVKYDEAFREVGGLAPAYFEVSFGEEVKTPDGISNPAPYVLKRGDDTLHLRGRIDRIDLGRIGDHVVFNILDYKSSSSKLSRADIEAGVILQLPLYSLAAEELLLADKAAKAYRAGYWQVRGDGFKPKDALALADATDRGVEPSEDWRKLRAHITDRVFSLVRGIRGGEFPMASHREDCTSRCEFSTLCRVGQARALEKTWQPPDPQ